MDESSPVAWSCEFNLGIDRWFWGRQVLYAPAHALFFQILRSASPQAARLLHDIAARKPFAVSPLIIEPVTHDMARGSLSFRTWDRTLIALLEEAVDAILLFNGRIRESPAAVLAVKAGAAASLSQFLAPGSSETSPVVQFTSPTFFSLGRQLGLQRYGLLPEPELVVGSWLRRWIDAGGPDFGAELAPGWLGDRVAVRQITNLQTVTVNGGKTALTGFTGSVRFAWLGAESWGPALLSALASFAAFCGTGAKTTQGFGVTQLTTSLDTRANRETIPSVVKA